MKKIVLAALLLGIATGNAFADLVIQVEHREFESESPEISKGRIMMTADKLKMEPEDPEQPTMIWRGDQQAVLIIEHESKSYMTLDRKMMQGMSVQLDQAMKQLEEHLKELPEEQRKMAEQMMKERMPQMAQAQKLSVEVRRTDEKDKVHGYPCTRFDVLVGGTKTSEIWVTDWKKAGVDEDSFAAFRGMSRFFRDLFESSEMLRQAARENAMFNGIDEIDGFPILIREYEDGAVSGETSFKSVQKTNVKASEFEVPEGYSARQQPFSGM
ncbi:MAG: DUF4412 domain-containing protein [Candidatus Krumholzibacteriia bacterium]